jgi:hypothetical protein
MIYCVEQIGEAIAKLPPDQLARSAGGSPHSRHAAPSKRSTPLRLNLVASPAARFADSKKLRNGTVTRARLDEPEHQRGGYVSAAKSSGGAKPLDLPTARSVPLD